MLGPHHAYVPVIATRLDQFGECELIERRDRWPTHGDERVDGWINKFKRQYAPAESEAGHDRLASGVAVHDPPRVERL